MHILLKAVIESEHNVHSFDQIGLLGLLIDRNIQNRGSDFDVVVNGDVNIVGQLNSVDLPLKLWVEGLKKSQKSSPRINLPA